MVTMEKKKELLNQIAQDIKKIKEQYKCLNLNNEEFSVILTKVLEQIPYLDNDELFILNIKEKVVKELNKKIKKYPLEEKKILINTYINDNYKQSSDYTKVQEIINGIVGFLKKIGYELNPESIIDLLQNNKTIENSIKIIVEKNLSLIKANGIENVFNNNLISFVEIYCDINNIETNPKFEDLNVADKNFGLVKIYLKQIKNMPILTREQEIELFERVKQGDEKAREIIIKSNLKLVVSVAKRHVQTGEEFLDLIQNGNLGLMKAIDRFDYTKGFKFSSYATWWIRHTIMREYQNKGRTVRLPVNILEKFDRIKKYEIEFENLYQRKPTIEEISKELGISVGRLNEIYAYQQEKISLNYMIGDREDTEITELIPNGDTSLSETVEAKTLPEEVEKLFTAAHLSEREKDIIKLRYGFISVPMTMPEIGAIYNLTRERVRQIEASAITKLRSSRKIKDLIIYMQNQKEAKSNLTKYRTLIEIGPKNKIYAGDNLDKEIEKYSKLYSRKR